MESSEVVVPARCAHGVEFGCERPLPNMDKTAPDAYYRGALGAGKSEGQANMRRWVRHRIEVDGTTLRWFQDEVKILEEKAPALKPGFTMA